MVNKRRPKVVDIRKYIDNSTGEVIGSVARELPDYFDADTGYRMLPRTKNLRVFPSIPFPDGLTRNDLGHLFFLSRSIWANTGALGKLVPRSFRPFDDDALIEHVGFSSQRRGRKWLARMVGLSMLRSIDVNLPDGGTERQWYINPVYFCPMFITRQAYLIWRDQIDCLLPEYVKRLFGAGGD